MMLIPYKMDTSFTRVPYANFVLIAFTTTMFFLLVFDAISEEDALSMVLQDWDLGQMLGNLFLHGGLFHLIGNMIFLWVFGNAVCATVGNFAYPFLYFLLGIFASASHLVFSGEPAIGASGAINGIVGMSLVLFPANKLHMWYCFSAPFMGIFWKSGKFTVRAYWMIIAWAVFDIIGVLTGGGQIAYWAHIGGFATGLTVGFCLLSFKIVETYDPTIMDVLAGRPLDRTAYTLEEVAAMPFPSTAGVQTQKQFVRAQASPAGLVADPLPVFRVTSVVQKGNDLMVFFVNDGDTIRNVALVAPTGIIQPSNQIGKRQMGTMRLTNTNVQYLNNLSLDISCLGGTAKIDKHLKYDAENRCFAVE
jgi:membrane associated rhomboid family serine protease